jgi:hypothetical protein
MATNVKNAQPGQKVYSAPNFQGTGAIVAGEALITDVIKYPLGTEYFDLTNRVLYKRLATAGVIGDWCKTVAFTVHS